MLAATAVCEHFRDQGKKVFLMTDTITRCAMAGREVGLSIGEPPTMKGYPPSIFSWLQKALERTGNSPKGSITALYTVLMEGDDINDPVVDTVRGIVDGHIFLSRKVAEMNEGVGGLPPDCKVHSNTLLEASAEVGERLMRRSPAVQESTPLALPRVTHALGWVLS